MSNPEQVIYFAETDARNARVKFGIKQKDRSRHVYVIGKTGMGKSTLLENMAVQDIQSGNGMCFIDPHGKTADLLLEYIPKERVKDVLYLAPFDMDYPASFNIMEDVGYDKRHLVVSGLMGAFKKIWKDAWSARMEYILSNTLFALLEYPGSTLLSVNKMLSDKKFRKKVVDNITDSAVKSFWVDEFANYTERMAAEAVPAIQNKVGQFTSNPLVRNIIGQPNSSFDIREMMDNKKIFIINLSKGRIGESNANLLGSLLITKIYLAAMSRADVNHHDAEMLPDFNLFVDEFQSFANESFAGILSEARKYKLSLHIAHQYIEQMEDEVRSAVFGNVGTMISFRVGSYDAEVLEKEFAPTFTQEDIVNLGQFQFYLRLMINGVGSKPFSARTIPPLSKPPEDFVKEVIDASREQFSRPRAEVEQLVKDLVNMGKEDSSESQKPKDSSKNNSDMSRSQKKKKKQEQKTEDKKPAISKDKELELKKQLQEAQRKAIDELPEEGEKIEIKKQEFISLKQATAGRKEVSKDNKDALKDALLKVLQQNGSEDSVVEKKIEEKKEEAPKKDEQSKEKVDKKPQPEDFDIEDNKPASEDEPIKPGEIPADELKKLLEVK